MQYLASVKTQLGRHLEFIGEVGRGLFPSEMGMLELESFGQSEYRNLQSNVSSVSQMVGN